MHEGKIRYDGKMVGHTLHEKSEVVTEELEHGKGLVAHHVHTHSLHPSMHKAKRIVKVDE